MYEINTHNKKVYVIRSSSGETPLSCAANAGKDDIVDYLLSFNEVSIPKSSQVSYVRKAIIEIMLIC